jgi:uncharacterized protein (TIGR02001 family)
MKTKFLTLALALGVFAAPAAAQSIEGNVALTTNYVFRGISQTGDGPAVSGGFDIASESGAYAGVWGSSVDFSDDTTMELDLYGGYGWEAGGFGFDVGAIYYAYPDSPDGQNFFEVYGGISHDLGPFAWDANLAYSPEFYGEIGPGWYVSTGLALPLNEFVSVDARVGASRFDDLSAADYEDYQLGLSGTVFETLGWDIRYFKASDGGDDGVFATISQSFGG